MYFEMIPVVLALAFLLTAGLALIVDGIRRGLLEWRR